MSEATHQPQKYSKVYPPEHIKAMEAIVALPSGTKRWRAVAATWVNINQMQPEGLTAKEAYVLASKNAQEKRENLANKFGLLKHDGKLDTQSGMRDSFEPPAGLWSWLKMFDMDSFGTPAATRLNLKALREEFPEFAIAEKY